MEPLTSSEKPYKIVGGVLLDAMSALDSALICNDGQKGTYQVSKSLVGALQMPLLILLVCI